MKQYRFLMVVFMLCCAFWATLITSCSKDEEPIHTISHNLVNNYELKNEEIVLDNFRINLDIYSRAGLILGPVFFEGSYTTDNYLQQIGNPTLQRKYILYNNFQIDSILYVRSNSETANIGFDVSNYNVTIFYKNGTTDYIANAVCAIKPTDIYTSYVCKFPIMKADLQIKKTEFCRTIMTIKTYLPYRGQDGVNLSEWQIKVYGLTFFSIKPNITLYPENSKSTQFQLKNIN